jgi:hypothetical protein
MKSMILWMGFPVMVLLLFFDTPKLLFAVPAYIVAWIFLKD